MTIFENDAYKFTLSPEELFIDHSKTGRGGHLGHAMVEYADNKLLCFYPNCSGDIHEGHSGDGWMEYKRSIDGGKTCSESFIYPYSKTLHELDFGVTSMSEKAVALDDGTIVVFNVLCDIAESKGAAWGDHQYATYTRSFDGGKTWTKGKRVSSLCGRLFDANVKDGAIYVLFRQVKRNKSAIEILDGCYYLFRSTDGGESFEEVSTILFPENEMKRTFYGTMQWCPDGALMMYGYNADDEFNMRYYKSYDSGKTWNETGKAHFNLGIRNPQLVRFKDAFFMFGRSEMVKGDFVVYCSDDGMIFGDGTIVQKRQNKLGAYSNTLPLGRFSEGGIDKVLIQASNAYSESRTNIYHWFLEAVEK